MKFSICVDMIFTHLSMEERIRAAAATGADAIEFWQWHNKDLQAIKQACRENNIAVAGMLTDSADDAVRAGISIVDSAGHASFAQAVRESCAKAKELGAGALIVTTGNELPGVERARQHDNVAKALKLAAPIAEGEGITLVLEPLNVLVDHKGYYLSTSAEAFAILEEVNSPAAKLLFDVYHQQITEGNVIANLTAGIARIGHFHMADVPGRHQSGTGELNYANIFAAIEKTGYAGYVGMEYMPTIDHSEAVCGTLALRP